MNAAANLVQHYMGAAETSTTNKYKAKESGEKMKALVFHGTRKVSIDEVPAPAVTEPKDVVLKITGTTVCGSDLHLYNKEIMQMKDGDILGHEFCGIVDEVGPEVTDLKKGDRVVSSFQIGCGTCKFCKEGLTSMCDTTNNSSLQEKLYGSKIGGVFGYSHFVGGYSGGQAEYVRVPFGSNNLLKIPDSVPDEKALYLSDVIPTSFHAVKCANVEKGSTVGIWGLGPIGLLSARWAQIFGAGKVIGIDPNEDRLKLAKDKLGIETINSATTTDINDAIRELVPIGLDCAIDAAGFRYTKGIAHRVQRAVGMETDTSETVNEALRAVRKFGNISLIADYAGTCNGFLIGALMEKGINLRGAGQCPVQRYWHDLLKLVEDGTFDPTIILTHRATIDDIPAIYDSMDKKTDHVIKTFVETRFSPPASIPLPKFVKESV